MFLISPHNDIYTSSVACHVSVHDEALYHIMFCYFMAEVVWISLFMVYRMRPTQKE